MTCLLVGTVTDLGHGSSASESPANSIVNTLGLAPAARDCVENEMSAIEGTSNQQPRKKGCNIRHLKRSLWCLENEGLSVIALSIFLFSNW